MVGSRIMVSVFFGGLVLFSSAVAQIESGGVRNRERRGVLVLTDGTRLAGRVTKKEKGFQLKVAGKSRRIPAGRVQKWLDEPELLAIFARFAAMPTANLTFTQAQRAIWALKNGLPEKAWPLMVDLLKRKNKPTVCGRLEELALAHFLQGKQRQPALHEQGRLLLNLVAKPKPGPIGVVRDALVRKALVELLTAEEALVKAKKKGRPRLLALCLSYAEKGIGTGKRKAARRALLDFDTKCRKHVYRLSVRYPAGKRRQDVVADIVDSGNRDVAASYLGKVLEKGDMTLKLRSANVLGDLASPKVLPLLRRMRSRVAIWQSEAASNRGSGGSGAGSSPRAFVSILTQKAYVKDFDVEIASSAFIADPQVGVVSDGAVLDVRLVTVQIRQAYCRLDQALARAIQASRR